MATSVYFNNYNAHNEQRLFEDLIVESIKIMGFDGYYLPNDNDQARDLLYGEDPLKKFTSAFPLELFLSSALEYTGEREFFSKFGLEIKNNVSVVLSKRTFIQRVPQNKFDRPREGDLIYVPVTNQTGELFEIKFVDATKDFFTLGRKIPYFYEMQLEKFKYSNEVIGTGIPDIDIVNSQDSYTINMLMANGNANYLEKEIVFQSPNGDYAQATAQGVVASWDAPNRILHITNIAGNFVAGHSIKGNTSGTNIALTSYDPLDVTLAREVYDNKVIQTEADQIIDFSEQNPFGEI
jgi:hypothetical protein